MGVMKQMYLEKSGAFIPPDLDLIWSDTFECWIDGCTGNEMVEVYIDALLHQTKLAYLVRLCDSRREVWLPKSCAFTETEIGKGEGMILVHKWLADKKELNA